MRTSTSSAGVLVPPADTRGAFIVRGAGSPAVPKLALGEQLMPAVAKPAYVDGD